MSYSSMRGSNYLLQENRIEAMHGAVFYFRETMLGTYSISTPGLKSSM